MHWIVAVAFSIIANLGGAGGAPASHPRHYVFFNRDRHRIADTSFLQTKALVGAQIKYTWRELEPEKGLYDFHTISQDVAFLTSKGKRLFVQLQDASFDNMIVNVPKYLVTDAEYNGGANQQFSIPNDDETRANPAGWVARRWDPAVRERFHKLLVALGRAFDGKVEGINMPETAVDFGESGRLFPKGFTPAKYRDGLLASMAALKRAFPKSVTMQYANFMPGEWLPGSDKGYLRSVYQRARELKVGVGGPDLLPQTPGQMNHCYPLIQASSGKVPTGIAVQAGNFQRKNPRTGQPITVAEMTAFATDYLQVTYVFWCTEEPFYSRRVIPFLQAQPKQKSANRNRAQGDRKASRSGATGVDHSS